jgi:hypothetical protein
MNPVHTSSLYFPKILWNVIFSSTPRSSEWSLPFRFSNQNTIWIYLLPNACYIPCRSYLPSFHHPNNTWWSLQVTKLLIMQSSPASHHFIPLRFSMYHYSEACEISHDITLQTHVQISYIKDNMTSAWKIEFVLKNLTFRKIQQWDVYANIHHRLISTSIQTYGLDLCLALTSKMISRISQ